MLAWNPRTERVAVVRNPRSGTAAEPSALAQAALRSGIQVTVVDAPDGAAFAPWIRRVAVDYDIIVAAGGDGTVSAVAGAVAHAGKTLAIIPTGTRNHFARDLCIPSDIDQAAALISTGRVRTVDVGAINDHVFINNVSIGNYPRMVHEREAIEKRGHSRTMATTIAVARTWWHLRKLAVVLDVDGRQLIRRSPFIVVANGSYVLSGLSLGTRDHVSDGKLSLYLAPPMGRIGVLSLPMRAFLGKLDRLEHFETRCASEITMTFRRRRIGVGIDGEVRELETPLRLAVRRQVLKVIVPLDVGQDTA